MKYCPGCMCPQPKLSICPFCHFQESEYHPAPTALPIDAMVGPYRVGALVAQNRQAQCYCALDTRNERPVLLEEFFPFTVVGRKTGQNQVSVARGYPNYEMAVSMFEHSTQRRCLDLLGTLRENNTVYRIYELNSLTPPAAQAERMLDDPIRFHDEIGAPLMTINGLPIPKLPKERKMRVPDANGRKKRSLIALGACAMLVVVLIVYFCVLSDVPVFAPQPVNAKYIAREATELLDAPYSSAHKETPKRLAALPANSILDAVELSEEGWMLCEYEDMKGYVRTDMLMKMSEDGFHAYASVFATPTPSPSPSPSPTPAPTAVPTSTPVPSPVPLTDCEGIYITLKEAILYQAPDENAPEIGSLAANTLVKVTGGCTVGEDAWLIYEYNGIAVYVRENLLDRVTEDRYRAYESALNTPTPAPAPTPEAEQVENKQGVYMTIKEVKLLKKPYEDAEENGVLEANTAVQARQLWQSGDQSWLECEAEGVEGYLPMDVLMSPENFEAYKIEVPTPTPAPTQTPASVRVVAIRSPEEWQFNINCALAILYDENDSKPVYLPDEDGWQTLAKVLGVDFLDELTETQYQELMERALEWYKADLFVLGEKNSDECQALKLEDWLPSSADEQRQKKANRLDEYRKQHLQAFSRLKNLQENAARLGWNSSYVPYTVDGIRYSMKATARYLWFKMTGEWTAEKLVNEDGLLEDCIKEKLEKQVGNKKELNKNGLYGDPDKLCLEKVTREARPSPSPEPTPEPTPAPTTEPTPETTDAETDAELGDSASDEDDITPASGEVTAEDVTVYFKEDLEDYRVDSYENIPMPLNMNDPIRQGTTGKLARFPSHEEEELHIFIEWEGISEKLSISIPIEQFNTSVQLNVKITNENALDKEQGGSFKGNTEYYLTEIPYSDEDVYKLADGEISREACITKEERP